VEVWLILIKGKIYNLPGTKVYYRFKLNGGHSYQSLFEYINKLDNRWVWKDLSFVNRLVESPQTLQVLYGNA